MDQEIILSDGELMEKLGEIYSICDKTVVVESNISGEIAVLDEGTVVMVNKRNLGKVHETFGPIEKPMYAIQADSVSDLEIGQEVFYVPDLSVWSITEQLRKLRGCDASNSNDEEISEGEVECSDDEKEKLRKRNIQEIQLNL